MLQLHLPRLATWHNVAHELIWRAAVAKQAKKCDAC